MDSALIPYRARSGTVGPTAAKTSGIPTKRREQVGRRERAARVSAAAGAQRPPDPAPQHARVVLQALQQLLACLSHAFLRRPDRARGSVPERRAQRTAPMVSPRTMYFCTERLSSNWGTMATSEAAAIWPHSTCSYEMNWIAPTVTGNVCRPASMSG